MFSTQSKWSNARQTIDNVFGLIEPMNECCRDYPNKFLAEFNEKNGENPNMPDYGFLKGKLFANSEITGYLPDEDAPFLGDMTTCNDYDFVQTEIIELSEASTISWWDIWISTGVFASLLLSPVVANYGIGLAKLADPLMVCDGMYEGPPHGFNFRDSEVTSLMDEIRLSLTISAFGQVVIWGILLNLLLLNVVLGKMGDDEEVGIKTSDAIVAGVILALSVITVAIAAQADKLLSQRIALFEAEGREIENTESESRGIDRVL